MGIRKHAAMFATVAGAIFAITGAASATTVTVDVNWGHATDGIGVDPVDIVGFALKTDNSTIGGAFSDGSISGIPSGWSTVDLGAGYEDYSLVRGGGGLTAATADAFTGNIGFSVDLTLPASPTAGDISGAFFAFFNSSGDIILQGLSGWFYNGTSWFSFGTTFGELGGGGIQSWQNGNAGFDELSMSVIPLPPAAGMALLGLGAVGLLRRRA